MVKCEFEFLAVFPGPGGNQFQFAKKDFFCWLIRRTNDEFI